MTNLDSPDWLNVPPIGAGIPLNSQTVTVAAGATEYSTPVLVANLAIILVALTLGAEDQLTETDLWLTKADVTKSLGLGLTSYRGGGLVGAHAMAVRAPYFTVKMNGTVATSLDVTVDIYGLPQSVPQETILVPSTVIDEQDQPLAGSGSNSYQPLFSAPGRYTCWAFVQENFTVRVERWIGGAWDIIYQQNIVISSPVEGTTFEFTAPADDWRVTIQNATATATVCWVAVTGPY